MDERAFTTLIDYLTRIPSVDGPIATGCYEDGNWWVKFSIDISHEFAWQTVQEFASVLNHISIDQQLPTRFTPTSPPPYLNGGPDDFLSWVIESTHRDFKPGNCMKWLECRLPNPVDDISQWRDTNEE